MDKQTLSELGVDIGTEITLTDYVRLYVVTGGAAAVELWHKLREHAAEGGFWPVICGGTEGLDNLRDAFDVGAVATAEEILAAVPHAPPLTAMVQEKVDQREKMLQWLKEQNPQLAAQFAEGQELAGRLQEEASTQRLDDDEDWPESPPDGDRLPASAFDIVTREPHDCLLAVVETSDPTTVPAYLRFGGFNDCPSSAVHVSFLRDWRKRFGAVPICVTPDVIEMWVPKPPQTREEATALAGEFEKYAPDIVHQGTQSVGKLAAELWRSPYWFFWWD